LVSYEAYQNALGIRSIGLCKPLPTHLGALAAASPECKFIALGSFDGKVRLMSVYSWQVAFALPLLHPRDMDVGFNCRRLLPTVEVPASAAATARFGSTNAVTSEEVEAEDALALGGEAPPATVRQVQVSPAKQLMRTVRYKPANQHVLLDRDGNVIQTGVMGLERAVKAGEGEEEEADEQALLCMESFFTLRALKSLPRAQAFHLEGKRTASAMSSSTRRPTAGTSGGASSSTSSAAGAGSASGFPAVGVSWVGWSSTGQFLAAREEAHPRCLWVWRPLQAQLMAVLVMLEPVTCARWRPVPAATVTGLPAVPPVWPISSSAADLPPVPSSSAGEAAPSNGGGVRQIVAEENELLAFCTNTSRVYFWSASRGVTFSDMHSLTVDEEGQKEEKVAPSGSSGGSGQGFAVASLMWSKDGRSLILRGKEAHCFCRVTVPAAGDAASSLQLS
jgi:hypothetical protein